ncbi:MAG TPA: hypothetical protein DC053_21445 [Lachnoclostridium sp.]|nr:hypothetical protein [Lachnoclostridium sp.]
MKDMKETVVENKKGNAEITRENQTDYCTEVDLLPDVEYEETSWSRIETLMKSTGDNLRTLARRIGYADVSSLSRARPGVKTKRKPRKISVVNLKKLAKYFNVSADYLLGLTDFPEPNHMKDSEQLEHIFYCLISLMLNFLPEDRRQPFMEKVMRDNK